MKKTPDDKHQVAAALIKYREQEEKAAAAKVENKPKATQPPFYPQPPKRVRFGKTQICSKSTPAETAALLKKFSEEHPK